MTAGPRVLRQPQPADADELTRFVAGIGGADRTFLDAALLEPDHVRAWLDDDRALGLVALDGERIVGLASLRPGTGWSAHVGLLRLVVGRAHRGRGVGSDLVAHMVRLGAQRRVTKIVVEVIASNASAVRLFVTLGFVPEATLRDHVRDAAGHHQDLVVLTTWVDSTGVAVVDDLPGVAG
jgi:ribosomal protein S18 acetylase RimI-like enzyme